MASDKIAKIAFCQYLREKNYSDIKICKSPVDVSAKLNNQQWWYEIKMTSKDDKYFGAATLTEWQCAINNRDHFRFVIARLSSENDSKFHFTFLTVEQFLQYSSIPPFKIYFNLSIKEIENIGKPSIEFAKEQNSDGEEFYSQSPTEKSNAIHLKESHITLMKKFYNSLQSRRKNYSKSKKSIKGDADVLDQ